MSSSVAPTPPDPSAPRAPQEDGCNACQEGRHEPSTQAVGVRPRRLPPNAADSQQALHSVQLGAARKSRIHRLLADLRYEAASWWMDGGGRIRTCEG